MTGTNLWVGQPIIGRPSRRAFLENSLEFSCALQAVLPRGFDAAHNHINASSVTAPTFLDR